MNKKNFILCAVLFAMSAGNLFAAESAQNNPAATAPGFFTRQFNRSKTVIADAADYAAVPALFVIGYAISNENLNKNIIWGITGNNTVKAVSLAAATLIAYKLVKAGYNFVVSDEEDEEEIELLA